VANLRIVFALTVVLACLKLTLEPHAQTPPLTSIHTDESDGREYRIHMRPALRTTECEFWWFQTGPFGGYGGSPPKRTEVGDFTLRTGLAGKPATVLKISIWCRGYRMALIDETELATSSFERTVTLAPLKELPISGRLLASADGANLAAFRVRVDYRADWLCSFFNLQDCGVPQWQVANGSIANDNTFHVLVPDFANDPAVKSWEDAPGLPMGAGVFSIDVSGAASSYSLRANGTASGNIPVATAYDVIFFRPLRRSR